MWDYLFLCEIICFHLLLFVFIFFNVLICFDIFEYFFIFCDIIEYVFLFCDPAVPGCDEAPCSVAPIHLEWFLSL